MYLNSGVRVYDDGNDHYILFLNPHEPVIWYSDPANIMLTIDGTFNATYIIEKDLSNIYAYVQRLTVDDNGEIVAQFDMMIHVYDFGKVLDIEIPEDVQILMGAKKNEN